jgi:hypothetical protein
MKIGYLFVLPLILLGSVIFSRCSNCTDCGPSHSYPFFIIRFFNVDSLLKVEATIAETQDSIDQVNQLIDSGYVEYDSVLIQLQYDLTYWQNVEKNIKNGKIKINEVEGTGTDNTLVFTDSLTNDSLTTFNFPLSMHADNSEFLIHIAERLDTLSMTYRVVTELSGQSILRRVYGINVTKSTYDSTKVSCRNDTCISNETSIYVYF